MKLNFIKTFSTAFLFSLILIISCSFLNANEACADFNPGEPIYVDADNNSGDEDGSTENPYNTIQEAVDAAVDNGYNTIFVSEGIYNENINVEKNNLSILSKSGAEKTIVQAENSKDNVFEIKADYVRIDGFTAKGTCYSNKAGIFLSNSNFCEISNNIISDNYRGMIISSSSNNILIGNKILNNHSNFYLSGNFDSHFDNSIDITNTINGKPIYYIQNAKDQVYGSSTNAGVFYCISCDNVTVKDLTVADNEVGIFFRKTENSKIENITALENTHGIRLNFSNNNTLTNNTISKNMVGILFSHSNDNILNNNIASISQYHGIYFLHSDSNTLTDNTVLKNYHDGILLFYSENNKIYHNNFIRNRMNSELMNSAYNLFDNGYPSGGNYWSDYNGVDLFKWPDQNQLGSDGIGDTPYELEDIYAPYGDYVTKEVYDKYPLMEENGWENPVDPYPVDPYPSPSKYAPNLWFDSDENYYPIDPFFYAEDINKITGISSKLNYLALSDDNKEKDKFTVFYHIAETEDKTQWVYEYFFYYAYNDFRNEHYHDWEGVFVFVDKKTEKVERVVASAHGNWVNNNEYFNPNFNLGEHVGIMIERGSHANCIDRNNDGLFQGSDITNGPFPFAWEIGRLPPWTRTEKDKDDGYQIQPEIYLPNLIKINDDFIDKFGKDENGKRLKTFLHSPALGIFCFEVPIFGGYKCLSNIGGKSPEHPWINEAYDKPEKIIPKYYNYIHGTINPLFIPGMSNPTTGIILIMSEEPYPFTFTNENGEFLINNIEPGEHNIIVNLENYAPYKQRFIIEENENEENEIIVGVNGILNLIPENESFRFEGIAKDEKGNLIINTTVDVYDENNQKLFTTLTDENGQYLFNLSSKNNHTIEIIQEDNIGEIKDISANPGETVIEETIVSNPKSLKENALSELKEIEINNQKVKKQINKIEKLIQESLDESFWTGNWHLKGKNFSLKVFQKEIKAVKRIEIISRYSKSKCRKNKCKDLESILPILNGVADDLNYADYLLAETILQETKKELKNLEKDISSENNKVKKKIKWKLFKISKKNLKKAENYLKKAKKQRSKKNYSKSIYYSMRSWNLSKQTKYLINLIKKG